VFNKIKDHQWRAGRRGLGATAPQLAILGGAKMKMGRRILKVGGKNAFAKKYGYFRQEKMCL
jgi:hypothetical protein